MNLTNVFESIRRLCLLKVVQWDWLPLRNGLNAMTFSFTLPTWRRRRRLQDDVLLINTDDEQCHNVKKNFVVVRHNPFPNPLVSPCFKFSLSNSPQNSNLCFPSEWKFKCTKYDTRSKMLFYKWRMGHLFWSRLYGNSLQSEKTWNYRIWYFHRATDSNCHRTVMGYDKMWSSRQSVMPQSNSIWNFLDSLTIILPRSRTGTVWFYTSTSNKRAARPKLYTKSLTRDLKLMYSRLTLVRISIDL